MLSLASSETPPTGGLDTRLIATIRLVISSSVLFSIGPSETDLSLEAFHIPSALYAVYSAVLYAFSGQRLRPMLSRLSYFADVGWVALLIALSDNLSLAFLFLFSTAIAAFQGSFVIALRLTLVTAIFSVAMGFIKAHQGVELQHREILLPPIYLVVFGYVLACWGAREIAAKRRLVLLKEIARLSNPRFGIDRMVGMMMERLRAFYDADTCLMIMADPTADAYVLRRSTRRDPERASVAEPIPAETAQLLLAPREQAVIYRDPPPAWALWRSLWAHCYIFDMHQGRRFATTVPEAVISAIDAETFVSVPLHYRDTPIGRIYLTRTRRRAFAPADLGFLFQAVDQMIPVIENIQLVDRLASSAAAEERRRLARDIHDNVIQTFIGFQIGLAALRERLGADAGDISSAITQQLATTDQMIDALRHYTRRLPAADTGEGVLLESVRRFVATFTEATAIEVRVEAAADLYINDRLAAEVFQMIVEGLSNIRRHTQATCASVELMRQPDSLVLQIANDAASPAPACFIPRSIAERATALGGQVRVKQIAGARTRVSVEIPL